MRRSGVTPHVTQNNKRRSVIDGRTTRHAGDTTSRRSRKRIEQVFDWMRTLGGLRKTRHRGIKRVGWMFTFVAAADNLMPCPSCWLVLCRHARILPGVVSVAHQDSKTGQNTRPQSSSTAKTAQTLANHATLPILLVR